MEQEADIVGQLAPLLRVRPELQVLCHFGAQWQADHGPEQSGWAPFHIVTFGACLLDAGEQVGLLLQAGDSVLLPHGGPHRLRAVDGADGAGGAITSEPRSHDDLIVKSNVKSAADTQLICGRLRFEQVHDNMVLAALPPLILFAADRGDDARRVVGLVAMMKEELAEDRLGAAAIAAALASSLLVMALRAHLDQAPTGRGILALLARRQSARALVAMLAEPARPWTLDSLAERARTSRATLVRQFRTSVDQAPLAFLAELRLTLARSRLRASRLSLAVIAEDVGYQSETAFSRAYRRRFGMAPGRDR